MSAPFSKRLIIYLGVGAVVLTILFGTILFLSRRTGRAKNPKSPEVAIPTIFNGDLVLPTVSSQPPLNKFAGAGRLSVVSANLAAIFDKDKLTGLRVLGEVLNSGDQTVTSVSPVIRLLDANGNLVAQKIARPTTGYEFHDLSPNDTTLFDVTLDDPPKSDKMEILFNITGASQSAVFEPLKIASRSMETRSTNVNSSDSTSTGSGATAGQKVDYYIVSGRVVNPLASAVTDVSIYAWARDEDNKVFAFGEASFKNDLINPGDGVDFRAILVPVRTDEKFASYEVAAWGKEYRLGL